MLEKSNIHLIQGLEFNNLRMFKAIHIGSQPQHD